MKSDLFMMQSILYESLLFILQFCSKEKVKDKTVYACIKFFSDIRSIKYEVNTMITITEYKFVLLLSF